MLGHFKHFCVVHVCSGICGFGFCGNVVVTVYWDVLNTVYVMFVVAFGYNVVVTVHWDILNTFVYSMSEVALVTM